jgi:hypothetical protein
MAAYKDVAMSSIGRPTWHASPMPPSVQWRATSTLV